MKVKSPDEVCSEYSDKKVALSIKKLGKEDILIEGNAISLEFLGKLFLAESAFQEDCGFSISPTGAGLNFFPKRSKLGLYIHRTPCLERGGVKRSGRSRIVGK